MTDNEQEGSSNDRSNDRVVFIGGKPFKLL